MQKRNDGGYTAVGLKAEVLGDSTRKKLQVSNSAQYRWISFGYLGAIIWPCDTGYPTVGSARQQIHTCWGWIVIQCLFRPHYVG